MISVRFESEVARQAGKAAVAAATAASTSADGGEVDLAGEAARRRVVDGAAAPGRPRDAPAADPVRRRRVTAPAGPARSGASGSTTWVMGRTSWDADTCSVRHDTAPGSAPDALPRRAPDPASTPVAGGSPAGRGARRRSASPTEREGDDAASASSCSTRSGPRTAASRQVKATTKRATAHRARADEAARRRRAGRRRRAARRRISATMRQRHEDRLVDLRTGATARPAASEPHGPGPT